MAESHYNLLDAHRAEKYVSKRYGHLSNCALHVYTGLRFLEEELSGFCRQLTATYRDIARVGHVSKDTVGEALRQLAECGLIKVEFGSSVKEDGLATVLTRVSIDDLRRNSSDDNGIAQRLADTLNRTPFMFSGKLIAPAWSVARTGRVCSSKPNIQGMKEGERVDGLRAGLPADHALVHADIRSADPTVIKHILGMSTEIDLYASYMKAAGCDRPTAKTKVNMLAYCKNSLAVFAHWSEAARQDAALSGYVEKLHAFKNDVFAASQKTRSVTTLTGRLIVAEKGVRLHAGMIFNWKVQGTVADIMNAAALDLLALPDVKVVVPLHDALYVVIQGGDAETGEKALTAQASKAGIQIHLTTETVR